LLPEILGWDRKIDILRAFEHERRHADQIASVCPASIQNLPWRAAAAQPGAIAASVQTRSGDSK
jgi:hypothetical protein